MKTTLLPLELKSVSTSIAEVLLNYESPCANTRIAYNEFMSKLGDKLSKKILTIGYKNNLNKFYTRFKRELKECKK